MYNRVFLLVSVALAVLVVVLGRQNLQLKKRLAEEQAPATNLLPGERLGPIQLVDPSAGSLPLAFPDGGGRTVLLFFTSTCPACRATLPVWEELFGSPGVKARVLGVNMETPGASRSEELVTAGLPFPVFGVEPERSQGLRSIGYVPATVILDADGIVRRVWFGELDDEQREELRRELHGS